MSERVPFKLWFNAELVHDTARVLREVAPDFSPDRFVAHALTGLDALEMSGRVGLIADALHAALPRPSARALDVLTRTLPPALDTTDGSTSDGYRLWPYGEYIARYTLDDRDAAFAAMIALTQRFTSEFAVRPYLLTDVDDGLDRLEALITHPNPHVRRWVSEGTRTRLPWGRGCPPLRARSERRLKLLSRLRHDPSPYVLRSVANHLQDALKDDLDEAWPLLAAWAGEGRPESAWVARHAARGLLKAGHAPTLALFGSAGAGAVRGRLAVTPYAVQIGEAVTLRAVLENRGETEMKLRVDFALGSPTSTGRRARKVFRWADLALAPGATRELVKAHAFVHRTIRTVHPGEHRFELIVNGEALATATVRVG